MEHNMVASSRIYDNISFKELGILLQISCQQVHDLATILTFLVFRRQDLLKHNSTTRRALLCVVSS